MSPNHDYGAYSSITCTTIFIIILIKKKIYIYIYFVVVVVVVSFRFVLFFVFSFAIIVSREVLATNSHTEVLLVSMDRRQNNGNADQYLYLYHWLRLLSATDFEEILA